MRAFYTAVRPYGILAGLLGAGSCTVYAPMQPTMPLLDGKGQAEFAASAQPNGRVEATAAYSPAAHLLVMAGGTMRPRFGTTNFLTTRQYELGIGRYSAFGTAWQWSAVAGVGQATNTRRFQRYGLFVDSGHVEYRARYAKYFAQVGLAHVDDFNNFGFTYRLTQVHFSSLTDVALGRLPLQNMLRHEVLLFWRRPWLLSNNWETQASAGISVGPVVSSEDPAFPLSPADRSANRVRRSVLLLSFGLVYHPSWGGR